MKDAFFKLPKFKHPELAREMAHIEGLREAAKIVCQFCRDEYVLFTTAFEEEYDEDYHYHKLSEINPDTGINFWSICEASEIFDRIEELLK